MKSTIIVLSTLLVFVFAGQVYATSYVGPVAFEVFPILPLETGPKLDISKTEFPPAYVKFKFKDPSYVTASFYTNTGKNDLLFQNSINLKTRFHADINDRFRAIAQFRCQNLCESLAVSITIIGRKSGQIFDHKDMVLARIP